jgi:hypothetical protein
MKKAFLVAVVVIFLIVFVGCERNSDVPDTSMPPVPVSPELPVPPTSGDGMDEDAADDGLGEAAQDSDGADVTEGSDVYDEDDAVTEEDAPNVSDLTSFAPVEEIVGGQAVMFFPFTARREKAGFADFVIYFAENQEVLFWNDDEDMHRVWAADSGGYVMSFGQVANRSVQNWVSDLSVAHGFDIPISNPTAEFPFYTLIMGVVSEEGHEMTVYVTDNGQGGIIHFEVVLNVADQNRGHGALLMQSLRMFELL